MKTSQVGIANLTLIDDLNPEDLAMVQALYSRSAESVRTHLQKVSDVGAGKFMSSMYVGYGHKSIADCGTTTVFCENVSLLAAKAIQDWPLYNGQETSTRYIDMGAQPIIDPVGTPASKDVLDKWMSFYLNNQARVADTVRQRYPQKEGEKDETYNRSVKARAFDILRGFLPAGICTQLSWHTNLRQAGDHLVLLTQHPSSEIRNLATGIRGILSEAYPSSGMGMSLPSVSGVKKTEGAQAREEWEGKLAALYTYSNGNVDNPFSTTIKEADLARYSDLLVTRPRGAVLPHLLSDLGQVTFRTNLDFGSFRDIQRHRNGVCRMPCLTTDLGFEDWYLTQLDPELEKEARQLLVAQEDAIEELTEDPVLRQYYTAIGYKVPTILTYCLPATLYVLELRSSKTVHPTLRRAVHRMIRDFTQTFGSKMALHVDMDEDDWDVRRGTQTITAKGLAMPIMTHIEAIPRLVEQLNAGTSCYVQTPNVDMGQMFLGYVRGALGDAARQASVNTLRRIQLTNGAEVRILHEERDNRGQGTRPSYRLLMQRNLQNQDLLDYEERGPILDNRVPRQTADPQAQQFYQPPRDPLEQALPEPEPTTRFEREPLIP